MKVKVNLDWQPYKKKPPERERGILKKRLDKCWQEIELEELADKNGNHGHTIDR